MRSLRVSLAGRLALVNVCLVVGVFALSYFGRVGMPLGVQVGLVVAGAVLGFPLGWCLVVLPVGSGPSSVGMIVVVAVVLTVNAFVWGHGVAAVWLAMGRKWTPPGERRRAAGLCPECGYDVRATPGRCPECGWVAGGDPGS